MSARLSVLFLLLPALVSAQPAQTVVTTLRTTSTSATALCVGASAAACSAATGGIKAGPVDVSSVTSAGFIGIANNVPADTTMRLYNNAGTLQWNGITLATGSSLSGTIGKLAKFTAADAVGDSICTESGSTITCVDTIATTTLTGTLSTASQPNVTTMAGLISVGTIGTGVWQGTKVNLAYGGTNADLSGTGGTSQFLRQNSVGGTVTVVRPAVTDLSDAANVALLNASNTFSATSPLIATATGAIVTATAASTSGRWYLSGNTGGNVYMGIDSSVAASFGTGNYAAVLFADGAGGVSISAANAAGAIRLYTGATPSLRWGVNAAGDWVFGPSSNIADSGGAPTCSANCSGATGTDFVFIFTHPNGTTSDVIDFGHSWSHAPVCITTRGAEALTSATVSQLTVSWVANPGGTVVGVLCRGY